MTKKDRLALGSVAIGIAAAGGLYWIDATLPWWAYLVGYLIAQTGSYTGLAASVALDRAVSDEPKPKAP